MVEDKMTLEGLQKMLHRIYNEHDRQLYGDTDLLLRINEEAGEISELVRKEDITGIIQHLPNLFVWLMAFIDRVGVDLLEAIWEKYPRICPYCLAEQNCMCITKDTKYVVDSLELKRFREKRENMPQSLNEWQRVLAGIYGKVNKIKMLIQVWLHVSEEIGEICRAYRKKLDDNLKEEMADTVVWTLSMASKLDVNLQELILERYRGRCDVCGKEKCQCVPM